MDWGLAFDIGEWVIRVVMVPVVAREHRAEVALGWLGLILFMPYLGLPLYFLFGELNLRHRLRAHAEVQKEVEARQRLREQAPSLLHPDFPRPVRHLAHLTGRLTEYGAFPVVDGNAVELVVGQREGIDRLVEDIDRAERHVHLLFFLYNGDDAGRRVGEALARAVRRGVRCRLLVDAWGSSVSAEPSFFGSMNDELKEKGVEVRSSLPARLLRRPLARLDIRNHRKIAVVDGRTAYTGSLNIHDPGFGLDGGEWEQLTVRLQGPGVQQLQALFVEDWRASGGDLLSGPEYFPKPLEAGEVAVQVIPGGPTYGTDLLEHSWVAVLNSARERAAVTTPYFVPDHPLRLALCLASLSGARVDLIVPRESDRRLADAVARASFPPLLAAGVHVHRFPNGLLHCKSMSADGQVSVIGSANCDRRSLFLNFEANLLIFDPAFTTALEACQEKFVRQARELPRDWWHHRPRLRKEVDQTLKLLTPLL